MSLQSSSWKFSKIFKTTLRNLVTSPFLVAYQPIVCKPTTSGKREFLEISRRPTFRKIPMHLIEFSNAEISLFTLLERHFLTDTLSVTLKILGALKENIRCGVSFQYGYPRLHGWLSCNLSSNLILQHKLRCYEK